MARGKAQKTLELIDASRRILGEIQPATVRAVCYRLFTEGVIPSMSKSNTNSVGRQLVWARENSVIPWEWIVDETREAERAYTWDNPGQLLAASIRQYRRDNWVDQPEWIEVWSEKGTVRGTVAPVLDKYGLTFRVMHGYGSATGLHDVANESMESDKRMTVLYVGDYDPAGMHMSEIDLPKRIERYEGDIDIERIAISDFDTKPESQVASFRAADKLKDTRYRWFVEHHGDTCFELDALSPVVLRKRIEHAILCRLDMEAWDRALAIEAAEQKSMKAFLRDYNAHKSNVTNTGVLE